MRNTATRNRGMIEAPTISPIAPVLRLHDYRRKYRRIFFTRSELNQLLSLYSRQVTRGVWRDYAIDQHDGAVLFSVFRHSQESPLYTIVKATAGSGRQAGGTLFQVFQRHHRLAAGASLAEVLGRLQHALGPQRVPLDSEAQH
jgi:hypothetical protein